MLRPDENPRGRNMTFLNYLSLLGVQQHIRPTQIIVHGDALPQGDWWRRAAKDVANIYFVNVTGRLPTQVYGKPLKLIEHRTDILRYRILYGIGIFPCLCLVTLHSSPRKTSVAAACGNAALFLRP